MFRFRYMGHHRTLLQTVIERPNLVSVRPQLRRLHDPHAALYRPCVQVQYHGRLWLHHAYQQAPVLCRRRLRNSPKHAHLQEWSILRPLAETTRPADHKAPVKIPVTDGHVGRFASPTTPLEHLPPCMFRCPLQPVTSALRRWTHGVNLPAMR